MATVDLFTLQSMLALLEELFPPRTFFQNLAFGTRRTYPTEYLLIDKRKVKRVIAEYQDPSLAGKVMDRAAHHTDQFIPPTLMPKRINTAADLFQRMAGEAPVVGSKTPQQRAADQLAMDLSEMRDAIVRRIELMSIQAVEAGTLTITGDGVNRTIDFDRLGTHTVTVAAGDRWDAGTAEIIEQLRSYNQLNVRDSGIGASWCVLGSDAAAAFFKNTKIKTQLETRRMDMGLINPTDLGESVTWIGRLAGLAFDIYSYDEYYYNGSSTVAMFPAKKIMMGSQSMRSEVSFAAVGVANEEADVVEAIEGEFIPEAWVQKEPAAAMIKITSKPLTNLIQSNATIAVTVLA